MNLIQIATAFRALNLYAHQAHHMCKGATFMQDAAIKKSSHSAVDV